jgi:hypothetical protein
MKSYLHAVTFVALLSSSAPSEADTWIFKDILRPGGHSRSMKVKIADAHHCGAAGRSFSDDVLPKMQPCMVAYGWALDRIIAEPVPRGPQRHNSSYEDDYELRKRNWEASDDAEAQRDEQSRNDEYRNQINGQ